MKGSLQGQIVDPLLRIVLKSWFGANKDFGKVTIPKRPREVSSGDEEGQLLFELLRARRKGPREPFTGMEGREAGLFPG